MKLPSCPTFDNPIHVALYTSAWIEIYALMIYPLSAIVALYTSAWIEIVVRKNVVDNHKCRTLHECVD